VAAVPSRSRIQSNKITMKKKQREKKVEPKIGQQAQIRFVFPRPEVFGQGSQIEDVIMPSNAVLGETRVFAFERAEYPEEGGIYKYYHGCLYPEKGLPFPQAIYACNLSKRFLIETIKLFAHSKKLMIAGLFSLEEIIKSINDAAEKNLAPFYYNGEYPRYYAKPCKEIKTFVETFLQALKVSRLQSERFAKNLITLIEQDNAYKYRIQDLAGVTTKEELMGDFIGEMKYIFDVYLSREFPNRPEGTEVDKNMADKFGSILHLADVAWILPRFRKAIRKGLSAVNWENLVMDEGDEYHTALWIDYNYQGKSFEERKAWFISLHDPKKMPLMISYIRK